MFRLCTYPLENKRGMVRQLYHLPLLLVDQRVTRKSCSDANCHEVMLVRVLPTSLAPWHYGMVYGTMIE